MQEPLLVTGATNVAYLTGFQSSNAAVFVEQDRVRLLADSRYTEAGQRVADVEFVQTGRILLADLAGRLQGRIAFEEDHISYGGFHTLNSGGLELVPCRGVVEGLRAFKDDAELETIRRASTVADHAFEQLITERWEGRTESELAWRLRMLMHEHGGSDAAFDVIVGSGPNGALPHAHPGSRRVQDGDLVVVDWGCLVDGYRSDCARTVAIGEPSGELAGIIDLCLQAQEAALSQIVPGMSGIEADEIARRVIAEAGYGDRFGHGLGHGIGLDVHEGPNVSPISKDTILVRQVVTIEPGIYLPGLGGVRIEDLCIVREDGLESLTTLPKRIVL